MWLRRHDERNESRSVERFSSAMRVLSRRGPSQSPGHRYVVLPARKQVAEVHVSGAPGRPRLSIGQLVRRGAPSARPGRPASVQPPRPAGARPSRPSTRPAPARPPVRQGGRPPGARRPASLAVRRRRNLFGLALAFLLSVLLLLVGVVGGSVPLVVGLLLVAYV